ncbi:MAG: hypothetical protein V3Q69_04280 [Burkholderia sp.]
MLHKSSEIHSRLRATVAGPASYQVRFQSNCLIFAKKINAQGHTQER